MNKKSKIVIIGGGTAGWLSALFAQKYTDAEVIVIASEELGVVGAGEGATPNIVSTLVDLDIPIEELFANADATVKTGIDFKNWKGDGTSYVHEFRSEDTVDPYRFDNDSLAISAFKHNIPLDRISFVRKCADYTKSPFVEFKDVNDLVNFTKYGHWGIHLNASLIIEVLRKYALMRSVKYINGHVKGVREDAHGNINEIIFNNGVSLLGVDFVVDCSGFSRILFGKHYNSEWVDHSHYLPINSAIPFFMNRLDDVPTLTEAIAMDYGWGWRIPLQGRYGCGYAYDSNYINRDDAISEIRSKFKGISSISEKTLTYKAGYFKDSLIKNCLCVGLSQGFIEPLEATNILIQCISLKDFFNNQLWDKHQSLERKAEFNLRMQKRNQAVGDFIHMHYLTSRTDTPFWSEFKEKNPTPERIKNVLNILSKDPLKFTSFCGEEGLWKWDSVLSVAYGVGAIEYDQKNSFEDFFANTTKDFIANQAQIAHKCISHQTFFNSFSKNLQT